MIQITPEPLAPERIRRIREWLEREEFLWLLETLEAGVASHQAEASNLLLTQPQIVLVENSMPPAVHNKMRNAARLAVAIEVLREISHRDRPFLCCRLNAGSAPSPNPPPS